jgi:pentatricopeptide repeat protein
MKRSLVSHIPPRRVGGCIANLFPTTCSTLFSLITPSLTYDDEGAIGWSSNRSYQGLGFDNPRSFSSTVPKNASETTVPRSGTTTTLATNRQARELEREMRSNTNQLLDPEQTPYLDDALWNEAQNILWWWVQQQDNQHHHHSNNNNSKRSDDSIETEEESVAMCFQILDRLASELPTNEMLFASILHTDLINAVLLLWRNSVVRRHGLGTSTTTTTNMQRRHANLSSSSTSSPNVAVGSKIPLPSTVAEKVDGYRWRSLVQPNIKTYNLILDAAASTYHPKTGVLFAQSLLEKMIQIDEQSSSSLSSSPLSGDDSLVVVIDVITVGSVIKAWVQSGLPEAPDRAYAWLEWLNSRSNNNDHHHQGGSWHRHPLRPNNRIYTMVMQSYAQVGNAMRAEEILERQLEDYQEGHGNVDAKPDTQTFNTVLLAWSKTRTHRQEAPRRAEAILQRMQEARSSYHDSPHNHDNSTTCRPDHYSLTSVLACWANSNLPGAAEEAECILQSFLQESGDPQQDRFVVSLPPVAKLIAYNTVLRAYSEAGNPQRADDMLKQLIAKCQPNDHNDMADVHPDSISFNQVIAGWSKATETHLVANAPHRAEALLAQMQALYQRNGWNTQPDASTYSSVLQCWAVSPLEDAADHAERIFREMQQQAWKHPETQRDRRNRHHHLLQPNVVHYNIVLTAWGNASRKWNDARAIARSNALIEEMIHSKGVVRPVERTFRILLHTVATSSARNKAEQAQTVVDWMTRHGFRPNSQDKKLLNRLLHKRSSNSNAVSSHPSKN